MSICHGKTNVAEVRTASIIRVIIIALMMEAVRTFETSVYSNENTRRYIPEGFNLQVFQCFIFPER
jgi:hypothetical protein